MTVLSQDRVDLNISMALEGLAVAYSQYWQDDVLKETSAQCAGRNIWSGVFVMPFDWRCGARAP